MHRLFKSDTFFLGEDGERRGKMCQTEATVKADPKGTTKYLNVTDLSLIHI